MAIDSADCYYRHYWCVENELVYLGGSLIDLLCVLFVLLRPQNQLRRGVGKLEARWCEHWYVLPSLKRQ